MHYMESMGYFGWVGMLLFWGAFIWLIVWLVSKNREPGQTEKTPQQIAKKRYAKGELTKKEYGEMKKELADN